MGRDGRGSGRLAKARVGSGTVSDPVRYCGREFSGFDLEVVRDLCASAPSRKAIADALCETLDWRRPDGRLKDMSARVALLRMGATGS